MKTLLTRFFHLFLFFFINKYKTVCHPACNRRIAFHSQQPRSHPKTTTDTADTKTSIVGLVAASDRTITLTIKLVLMHRVSKVPADNVCQQYNWHFIGWGRWIRVDFIVFSHCHLIRAQTKCREVDTVQCRMYSSSTHGFK